MNLNKSVKVLIAGAVFSSGLFISLPTDEVVLAANQELTTVLKLETKKPVSVVVDSDEYATFEELKQFAIDTYLNPPPEGLVNWIATKTNLNPALEDWYFYSKDASQDLPGHSFNGRSLSSRAIKLADGTYEIEIWVTNRREEEEQIVWEKKMDKAEKYIVENYKLETDYDVVFAINDFVSDQITYGYGTAEDNQYLDKYIYNRCMGYTDVAQELYKRFGIKNRTLSGSIKGSHAWNAVYVGGEWYHSDATFYDSPSKNKKKPKYLLFTEIERGQDYKYQKSNFRATNKPWNQSMALPYSYEEVKKAQAKK